MAENRQADAAYGPGFDLKTPMPLAGRTIVLLWGMASLIMGLVTMYLLIRGEIRLLVLLSLALLGVACLSLRNGIYILTAFLPFMYFLRRQVLYFQEYDPRDPILLFPAATTLAMFAGLLLFRGRVFFHYFRESLVLKYASFLMLLFIAAALNPLQSSVLVGVAGVMYFIVPMAWLFFGLLLNRDDMRRIMTMVLVIGTLTACYGLFQHYFGLSSVEIMELKAKQFLKGFGGISKARVMSTFAGLSDFATYMTLFAFVAAARFAYTRKKILMGGLFLLANWAMLWSAIRTSFLVLVFTLLMLLTLTAKSVRGIVVRAAVLCLVMVLSYGVLYTYDPGSLYGQGFSDNPFVVHTISGITHPTQENTFKIRIRNWKDIVVGTFTTHPLGHGLGSTTTAARKFGEGKQFETDSYFFELFYGSGLGAPPVFMILIGLFLSHLLVLCLKYPHVLEYRVCFCIICGTVLSSVFGQAFRDNISGPLVWLMMGWAIREGADRRQELEEPAGAVLPQPAATG